MSKKKWLLVLLIVIAFGGVLASKFVVGFDQAFGDTVVGPVTGAAAGFVTAVTTHPVWIEWGNYICFGTGVILSLIGVAFVWPRVKSPAKKQMVVLQDKLSTTPTQIPTQPTKAQAVTPVAEPIVEEVEA